MRKMPEAISVQAIVLFVIQTNRRAKKAAVNWIKIEMIRT
jgi:hypothetical protein